MNVLAFAVVGSIAADVATDSSRLTYRVNETEAAVVRRIFALAGMGEGVRSIAKRLNGEGLTAPRPQQGRSRSWAPSSVWEVLHREMYRGRRVWNKTRKRDSWGQQRQADRPASDWLAVEDESLRIVSDAQWHAAHHRAAARRSALSTRSTPEEPRVGNGRGVRSRYFLTGFGSCSKCGGSIQAVSRSSSNGRNFRYTCATYWNRGRAVCDNGRALSMPPADQAVHDVLRNEVLRPKVIERALELAIATLSEGDIDREERRLTQKLAALDAELQNLTAMAASGGAVPVILQALITKDAERRTVAQELATMNRGAVVDLNPKALRRQLQALLDDWRGLLTENVTEARPLLSLVLAGRRITFTPRGDEGYELIVPVAIDRMLSTLVPLSIDQVLLASPTGFEPVF